MNYRPTIAGSLPKPAWLAQTETLWPRWRSDGEELREAKRDAIRIAVAEQQHAGIDCVTDGEQARVHFVHGFVEARGGIDTQNKVRKGIRTTATRRIVRPSLARSSAAGRFTSLMPASRGSMPPAR